MTRRRDRDRELDEEVRTHLAMATRDRIERGEEPAEAAAAARREFGNVAQVQEVTREMWGWTWLERLAQDVRYAVRLLAAAPAFSIVAIVSLAVAIGANAAIFQVNNAVRLRALPVARPHELVEIAPVSMEGARGNFSHWGQPLSNPIWEQIRDHQEAFDGTFAYGGTTFNLATGGEVRTARGLFVSGSFFDVLEVRPERGRLLTAADDHRGCPARAAVSHGFWQRELAGSPAAIGSIVHLDSQPVEIIGVVPARFAGLEVGRTFDIAVPICAEPAFTGGAGRLDSGTNWWLVVMGRLKRGVTIDRATAHLQALSPGIFRETLEPNYPQASVPKYLEMQLHALPASTGISNLREVYGSALWLLLGLAALVLLIACANLANLMLARASAREREIAIRLGLGASRGRVIRQLLTESVVLSTAGACLGLVLAGVLSDALVMFVDGGEGDIVLDLATDWAVIAFTAGLAALTCLLFGLVPAIRATRVESAAVMKSTGRGLTSTREGSALRRSLVVAQVAISLVLLFGALLFTRTLRNLASVDAGFSSSGVVMTQVDFRRVALAPDQRTAYKRTIVDRVRAIPGVEAAAATTLMPVSGDVWGNTLTLRSSGGPKTVSTLLSRVSEGYFATVQTAMIAGRDFDPAIDTVTSPLVAVVNQTFAAMFDGGQAVGARFRTEAAPAQPVTEYQVIGVVADSKYLSLRQEPAPVAYLPMSQEPQPGRWALLAVRGRLDPAAMTSSLVQSLRELNPNIGVSFTMLDRAVAQSLMRERLMATLSSFFGSIAAALAVIGLYGVIAYTVNRRTQEIGVRMALGATRAGIASMVLREAGLLVAVGVSAGLILALLSGRLAESLLFGLDSRDPFSIVAAAVLLGSVALLASYLPARAAANIEPTTSLRAE
jgi:predicted permease